MSGKSPIKQHGGAVHLRLRVQPRASRNAMLQESNRLRVRLTAPPVEGEANRSLCAYLAECFSIPPRRVRLVSGDQSREKVVALEGLTVTEVQAVLDGTHHTKGSAREGIA
jgi:uncharacterized protein